MIKKLIAYQKMISSVQGVSSSRGWKMFAFIFLFMIANIGNIIIGFKASFGTCFFIVGLFMGAYQIANVRKSLLRNLPVSDGFAVINCMIVMPAWLFLGVFGILTIMGIFSYAVSLMSNGVGGDIFEVVYYEMIGMNGSVNLSGCLFAILLAATIWFYFCMAIFTRNKKVRVIICALLCGIYVAIEILMLKKADAMGYYGRIRLSDIVEIFPKYPLSTAVIILAIGSGIICYKYCVKMLRYDIKGQRTVYIDETKEINQYNMYVKQNVKGGNDYSKRRIISLITILVCVTCLVVLYRGLGLFGTDGETKKYEYTASSVDQYEKWKEMGEECSFPLFDYDSTTIFPEKIEGRNVVEYRASKYGTTSENGWDSFTIYRFLVQKLSKEDFEAEKERIASIYCEATGDEFGAEKVNHILHDTEHFSNDAYIARYDCSQYLYEYAIVDEKEMKITYLFCNGENPKVLFNEYDIFPSWTDNVISIEDANTNDKGFDIESFYNSEHGMYEDAYSIYDEE